MMIRSKPAFRVSGLFGAVVAGLVAAACTTPSQQSGAVNAQPRLATYQCGEDGNIRVESRGSAVILSDGEDLQYEMVAAPPNQRSRYGADGLALVIEGREALWMKAGKPPLTCRR